MKKIECPDCNGTGYIECPECDGDGNADYVIGHTLYEEITRTFICRKCDGDKKIECPECDGTGYYIE